MTDEEFAAWVAEQVSYFEPGDLDAGIEIMRRHRHRQNDQRSGARAELNQP